MGRSVLIIYLIVRLYIESAIRVDIVLMAVDSKHRYSNELERANKDCNDDLK